MSQSIPCIQPDNKAALDERIRLLLVDDNPDHRELMISALRKSDMHCIVEGASSGEECLKLLSRRSYSSVIIDYNMRDMSGLQVLSQIGARGWDVPVIMVTGMGDENIAVEAMKCGAYDYITKSVGYINALPLVVRKTLERHDLKKREQCLTRELRESEERYRSLFEVAGEGILVSDPDTGEIRFVNRALCDMLEYPMAELRRMKVHDLHPPEELPTLFPQYHAHRLGVKTVTLKTPCLRRNKSVIYADIIGTRVIINGKESNIDFFTDITERKQAEDELHRYREHLEELVRERTEELERRNEQLKLEIIERRIMMQALRESEETIRALLNAITRPITMVNIRGIIYAVNESAALLYRRTANELTGTCMYDYLPTEIADIRKLRLMQVRQTGNPARFEESWGERVYDTHTYPVFGADGSVESIVVYSADISEQRRLQREVLDISEKERIRIGHDLHDGIGQYFTGLGYMTRMLINLLEKRGGSEHQMAQEMLILINEAKNHVRLLAKGLCPVHMGKSGLVMAVQEMCLNARRIYSIACTFIHDSEFYIEDPSLATHLYYIIQEALNNAVEHGKARSVQVLLKKEDAKVKIIIKDNGTGFKGKSDNISGMGLNLMQYRADIIGAALTIEENETGGVTVQIILPFPERTPKFLG